MKLPPNLLISVLCFLILSVGTAASAAPPPPGSATPATRGLKICVASDAPADVRRAAEAVLAAAKSHPLLSVFTGPRGAPAALTDTKSLLAASPEARAYDHLLLIGLPDDPLVRAAWQREARPEPGGLYVFGFGHLGGDIGYVESDRNPFLHSRPIARAPYETQVVTITGTTPSAVALAAEAFLKQGLVNGAVAPPGWKRAKAGLLDRDPLPPDFTAPDWLPREIAAAPRVGLSQAGEDEYRGVLEDTGVEPREIWRAKYYPPGAWDGAGADKAYDDYSAGLHRRAYGNTLWCARFESEARAAAAAPKVAGAANLKKSPGVREGWEGAQPPYGPQKESAGPLALWRRGEWLLMSTLPRAATDEVRGSAMLPLP